MAIYCLKLTDHSFWGLTLRKYIKLLKKWEEERDRQDRWMALLCSTVANAPHFQKKGKNPWVMADFMPKPIEKQSKGIQTPSQMLETVKGINAALGGKIIVVDDPLSYVPEKEKKKDPPKRNPRKKRKEGE